MPAAPRNVSEAIELLDVSAAVDADGLACDEVTIEKRQDRWRWRGAGLAYKVEAILEARSAIAGVFMFRREAKRLAEIFLVQTMNVSFGIDFAIIAFNEKERTPFNMAPLL